MKNGRAEIIVLRNKFKPMKNAQNTFIKASKEKQTKIREEQLGVINKFKSISGAALKLTGSDKEKAKDVVKMEEIYTQEAFRINDLKKDPDFIEKINN